MMDEVINSEIPILKFSFPDGFGSALILTRMLPRQLTDMSIIKIRNYLLRPKNREYALRRLIVLLKCKESYLQGLFDNIINKTVEIYNEIEDATDLNYNFWAHFAGLAKGDIIKKGELLSGDIAAYQSFSIIEAVNGYFKALAKNRRIAELALGQIEDNLAKPPYFFTMGQILKFTDTRGTALLGQYSTKELETWLWEKVTENQEYEMPILLILAGTLQGEKFFVLKEKIIPLCLRLLIDAQPHVKNAIIKRWSSLLFEYEKEPSMKSDKEFEILLPKVLEKNYPLLMSILLDPRLLLISQEMERKSAALTAKIFEKGQMLPYSKLLMLDRQSILSDAKLTLPLWYSIPILAAIAAFFKRLFRKSEVVDHSKGAGNRALDGKNISDELRIAAKELCSSLTPVGRTQDQYLKELQDRWCQIIDNQARENLLTDVHNLARDCLRYAMKTQKFFRPNRETISQIAWNAVNINTTLSSLKTKDALILYLEVYILDLFENMR
jgi:hypothetical protein